MDFITAWRKIFIFHVAWLNRLHGVVRGHANEIILFFFLGSVMTRASRNAAIENYLLFPYMVSLYVP